MIYRISGMEFPSVTTIQGIEDKGEGLVHYKLGIILESVKDCVSKNMTWEETIEKSWDHLETVSNKTTGDGNIVHKAVEIFALTGKLPNKNEMTQEAISAFRAFLKWVRQYSPTFLHNELVLYSEEEGIAGTADIIAVVWGKIYIIDLKTSKEVRPEYKTQSIAYKKLYNEMIAKKLLEGDKAEGTAILRLDKYTGEFEWKDYTLKKGYEKEEERLWEAYRTLVKYWYLSKRRRLKNNPYIERMEMKIIS